MEPGSITSSDDMQATSSQSNSERLEEQGALRRRSHHPKIRIRRRLSSSSEPHPQGQRNEFDKPHSLLNREEDDPAFPAPGHLQATGKAKFDKPRPLPSRGVSQFETPRHERAKFDKPRTLPNRTMSLVETPADEPQEESREDVEDPRQLRGHDSVFGLSRRDGPGDQTTDHQTAPPRLHSISVSSSFKRNVEELEEKDPPDFSDHQGMSTRHSTSTRSKAGRHRKPRRSASMTESRSLDDDTTSPTFSKRRSKSIRVPASSKREFQPKRNQSIQYHFSSIERQHDEIWIETFSRDDHGKVEFYFRGLRSGECRREPPTGAMNIVYLEDIMAGKNDDPAVVNCVKKEIAIPSMLKEGKKKSRWASFVHKLKASKFMEVRKLSS